MRTTIFASSLGLGALVVALGACNSVATPQGFAEGSGPGGPGGPGASGR